MQTDEYDLMRRVEDAHWWYGALRAHLRAGVLAADWPGGARVLDAGCGTGANAQLLGGLGFRAVPLDLAPEALAHGRSRGIPGLVRGNVLALPFAPERFAGAVLADVLYHSAVGDHAQALREVYRVLAPGGSVLVNVPAFQGLYSAHDKRIHTGKRFTKGEVRALLEAAGFTVTRLYYWNVFLFPLIAAMRLLRREQPAASDLEGAPPPLAGAVLRALLGVERRLIARVPAPFGVSIFAVARKTP
ncbi:MAG: methyltransferase domain-containing protein [Candidatus Hydrogenedentes bacterium]|nr:methyltransferase domain-containing protein [Candidatus Hydrogenedentota bacterium]